MNIDILHVRSISLAARAGSLSRAAEELNISQPALSRRISEAELSLGFALFERLPRGVKPTDGCIAFLRHAEAALTSINEGIEAAQDVQRRRDRIISISFLEVLCDALLTDACETTRAAFTGTSIMFDAAGLSTQVSAGVLSGETKLGLRYRRDTSPQLEAVWLADDPVVAACAPLDPLAGSGRITMEQLEQAQWLGFPTAMDLTTSAYLGDVSQTGFQHWSTMKVSTIYSRIRLIEAGVGIALVRRACIEDHLLRGTIVELDTPLNTEIPVYLTWRRGSYLGDVGEYLRDHLVRSYKAKYVAAN